MNKVNISKKVLSLFLASAMTVSQLVVPVQAGAAEVPENTMNTYMAGTEKSIANYKVSIKAVDSMGEPVPNASVSVSYYDDWDMVDVEVEPVNGVYDLDKYTEYTYSVSAPGYVTVNEYSYTPSGDSETIQIPVTLLKDSPDVSRLTAIKKKFDSKMGPLRPKYKTDKNIVQMVQTTIEGYTDLDTSGVSVSLKSTDNEKRIAKDGTILYVDKNELSSGVNSENVGCTFAFTIGEDTVVSGSRNVTVGWDQEHVNKKIQEEAAQLTMDKILGDNKDAGEITSDLVLPCCMTDNLRNAWSVAEWTSSDPDVIGLVEPSVASPIYPFTGKVTPAQEDTKVTLTAVFKANSSILNSYVETPADFAEVPVSFEVTVKGAGPEKPTEEELLDLLDRYYTQDLFKDAVTGDSIDINNVTNDILLPRYTKIKDESGNNVFANKEIKVTSSDESVLKINGYRGNVDRFYPQDKKVDLIVTFTREGVTVVRKVPLNIIMVTEEQLDQEIQLMNLAKEHYFDGINQGIYENADNVTGNLCAFMEMTLDPEGQPLWIYQESQAKHEGIIPDSFFDDPWEMESAGYNRFRSSDPVVINHDNLLVTRPESSTKVEISSLLSSARYGKYAPAHPENEKLQRLYKQPVSVTVTVTGTKEAAENLAKAVSQVTEQKNSIVEGTGQGQYPEGTIEKLENALKAAQAKLDDPKTSEKELAAAAEELLRISKEADNSQNPVIENITVLGQKCQNQMELRMTLDVSSDDAEKAGYYKEEEYKNSVTIIDALVAAHRQFYGKSFEENPEDYMIMGKNGFVTAIFGEKTTSIGYLVNDRIPMNDANYTVANNSVLHSGDVVAAFVYSSPSYEDMYLAFEQSLVDVMEGSEVSLVLRGYRPGAYPAEEPMTVKEGYTVRLSQTTDPSVIYDAVTDENGQVVFEELPPGEYTASVVAGTEYFIEPYAEVSVKAVPKDQFVEENGLWYYYQDGQPVTGWAEIEGSWYYFNEQGVMLTEWQSIAGEWYYLGMDGAMVSQDWRCLGGKWYYFQKSGAMAEEQWLNLGGEWYYFQTGGAMACSQWQELGAKWYYFDADGTMASEEWKLLGGIWYYFNADGTMAAGEWKLLGGIWYYFDGTGAMAS